MSAQPHASDPVETVTLTAAQAAKYAGVSKKSIYRAIEDGKLAASQPHRGCRLLIRREWVDAWIEAGRVAPRARPRYALTAERHQPRRGLLKA